MKYKKVKQYYLYKYINKHRNKKIEVHRLGDVKLCKKELHVPNTKLRFLNNFSRKHADFDIVRIAEIHLSQKTTKPRTK